MKELNIHTSTLSNVSETCTRLKMKLQIAYCATSSLTEMLKCDIIRAAASKNHRRANACTKKLKNVSECIRYLVLMRLQYILIEAQQLLQEELI